MDCWIYLAVLYQPFFEIMNYYEQKHAAFMQHAEKLKSFGFRVFVSTSKNFPNYGKFCDKRGILGYFQLSEFLFGVDFSTLHHGSKQLGYGLSCCRNGKELRDLRSEEHTSELQSRQYLVCRLLLEKKNKSQVYQKSHK